MASISNDADGGKRIQFVDRAGKRRAVRVGNVTAKAAQHLKLKIEHLNALACLRQPLDAETSKWTTEIGDDLHRRLAAVGLVEPRQTMTLGAFLDDYRERHFHDWTPGTRTQNEQRCENLTEAFGADRELRSIANLDAEKFRDAMYAAGLSDATIHRRIRAYRTYFRDAVRRKLIPTNPFADVRSTDGDMSARQRYIPAGDVLGLMGGANSTWRTIIALSRFAGLRTPSETLMLRIDQVNMATGRMVIDSTKTGDRVAPITATLRPFMAEALGSADAAAVYVVHGPQADRYRETSKSESGWLNTNLRTAFLKLVKRAGLEPWPKPFHNMRASCETDLNEKFPAHVVAKWMGHSMAVAEKHYLQMRDSDMDRATGFEVEVAGGAESGALAAQIPAQPVSARSRQEPTRVSKTPINPGICRDEVEADGNCRESEVTRQGFEP